MTEKINIRNNLKKGEINFEIKHPVLKSSCTSFFPFFTFTDYELY